MKKMSFQRLVCGSLTLVFFISNSVFSHAAESNFWAERKSQIEKTNFDVALAGPFSPSLFPLTPPSLKLRRAGPPSTIAGGQGCMPYLQIPFQFGSVRKIIHPTDGDTGLVVFQVQDVHQNFEAQTNIGNLVKEIVGQKKVGMVALEGTTERLNFTPYQNYSDKEAVHSVADYFLRSQKISGPVHAALVGDASFPPLVGIDDAVHYKANVQAYRDSAPLVASTKEQLKIQKEILLKDPSWSQELLKIQNLMVSYSEGTLSIGEYVKKLSAMNPGEVQPAEIKKFTAALGIEKSLDLKKVEEERAALLSQVLSHLSKPEQEGLLANAMALKNGDLETGQFYGKILTLGRRAGLLKQNTVQFETYVRYARLCDSLDAEKLLHEVNTLERNVIARAIHSQADERLINTARYLSYANKLVKFALTKEEWKDYKKAGYAQSLDLATFERFYEEAEIRDHAMVENLLSQIQVSHHTGFAVLVTGGFHTEGMANELKARGVTTVTITPRLTKLEDETGSSYLSAFTEEKTPLEKLVEGQKLFTATDPCSPATRGTSLPATTLGASAARTGIIPPTSETQAQLRRLGAFEELSLALVDAGPGKVRETIQLGPVTEKDVVAYADGQITVKTMPISAFLSHAKTLLLKIQSWFEDWTNGWHWQDPLVFMTTTNGLTIPVGVQFPIRFESRIHKAHHPGFGRSNRDRTVPTRSNWTMSWGKPKPEDLEQAEQVSNELLQPENLKTGPGAAFPSLSLFNNDFSAMAKTLRALYYDRPDFAYAIMLSLDLHGKWRSILTEKEGPEPILAPGMVVDLYCKAFSHIASILGQGNYATSGDLQIDPQGAYKTKYELEKLSTLLAYFVDDESYVKPIIDLIGDPGLCLLLNELVKSVVIREGVSPKIRVRLEQILNLIPDERLVKVAGILPPEVLEYFKTKGKSNLLTPLLPPIVDRPIPVIDGKAVGILVVFKHAPTEQELNQIPHHAIVAMDHLPTSNPTGVRYEGILTYRKMEETSHAQEQAHEWRIPHALWPGADSLKEFEGKWVFFEVAYKTVTLRLAHDPEIQKALKTHRPAIAITLPKANLDPKGPLFIPGDDKRMASIEEGGYKIGLLHILKQRLEKWRQSHTLFDDPRIGHRFANDAEFPQRTFKYVMEMNGVWDIYQDLLRHLNQNDAGGVSEMLLFEIRGLIMGLDFEKAPKLIKEVGQHSALMDEFFTRGVFVRGAANAQSLPGHRGFGSGQYLTVPNVRDRVAFYDAVKLAWVSLYGRPAVIERRSFRVDEKTVASPVWFVESQPVRYSFILQTSLGQGLRSRFMVFNVVQGLGESLVGENLSTHPLFNGRPTRIIWDREKGTWKSHPGTKQYFSKLRTDSKGRTVSVKITKRNRDEFIENTDHPRLVRALAQFGEISQLLMKGPQEIEGGLIQNPDGTWTIVPLQTSDIDGQNKKTKKISSLGLGNFVIPQFVKDRLEKIIGDRFGDTVGKWVIGIINVLIQPPVEEFLLIIIYSYYGSVYETLGWLRVGFIFIHPAIVLIKFIIRKVLKPAGYGQYILATKEEPPLRQQLGFATIFPAVISFLPLLLGWITPYDSAETIFRVYLIVHILTNFFVVLMINPVQRKNNAPELAPGSILHLLIHKHGTTPVNAANPNTEQEVASSFVQQMGEWNKRLTKDWELPSNASLLAMILFLTGPVVSNNLEERDNKFQAKLVERLQTYQRLIDSDKIKLDLLKKSIQEDIGRNLPKETIPVLRSLAQQTVINGALTHPISDVLTPTETDTKNVVVTLVPSDKVTESFIKGVLKASKPDQKNIFITASPGAAKTVEYWIKGNGNVFSSNTGDKILTTERGGRGSTLYLAEFEIFLNNLMLTKSNQDLFNLGSDKKDYSRIKFIVPDSLVINTTNVGEKSSLKMAVFIFVSETMEAAEATFQRIEDLNKIVRTLLENA